MLYIAERHQPLCNTAWSAAKAEQVIAEITNAALAEFQNENLWPLHPDLLQSYKINQVITGLWHGAAGTMWALDELHKNNSALPTKDFTPYLQALIDKQTLWVGAGDPKMEIDLHAPGYLLGYAGANLLHWRLTHSEEVLIALEKNIAANHTNRIHEIMWAAPGTMLCAWFLYQQTGAEKFAKLFQESADYLFSVWQPDSETQNYAWVQHMYGVSATHLGLVHGFAGVVFPLLKGMDLLSDQQKALLIERTQQTLLQSAKREKDLANWLPCLGKPRPGRDELMVQICHGAPGMIIGTALLWPQADAEFKKLLLDAGNLIWQAGPLEKPWGLCHGTAGNGYAFLKLYQYSGDEIWLERARQFAMHAIQQYQTMRDQYQCIRTDAWCGDLGLALYLQDCISERTDFPMLDYF